MWRAGGLLKGPLSYRLWLCCWLRLWLGSIDSTAPGAAGLLDRLTSLRTLRYWICPPFWLRLEDFCSASIILRRSNAVLLLACIFCTCSNSEGFLVSSLALSTLRTDDEGSLAGKGGQSSSSLSSGNQSCTHSPRASLKCDLSGSILASSTFRTCRLGSIVSANKGKKGQ
jgi:hypothetical protein